MFRKPNDDEIDVYGLTHRGLVRESNQDHFLIGSLRQRLNVLQSSLPDLGELPISDDRLAFLMIVADGVGGGRKGEAASQLALEEVPQYITQSVRCYYSADTGDTDFTQALETGAIACHKAVRERGAADPETAGMATTVTLRIGGWPFCYLVPVGDPPDHQYRQ